MSTIEIHESTLAQLKANADARKLSLEAYLDTIAITDATRNGTQLAALRSFSEAMSKWTVRNIPAGHVVDDSRESIYPDRD